MGDEAGRSRLGSLLIAVVLLAGCGGGGNGGPGAGGSSGTTGGGTYRAKCEVGCRPGPTTGVCTSEDPTQCTNDCTALTEGLTVDCATCIAQHTYWQPSGGTCLGFSIPATTGSECVSMCTPAHPG
jgi:hypothetical protein